MQQTQIGCETCKPTIHALLHYFFMMTSIKIQDADTTSAQSKSLIDLLKKRKIIFANLSKIWKTFIITRKNTDVIKHYIYHQYCLMHIATSLIEVLVHQIVDEEFLVTSMPLKKNHIHVKGKCEITCFQSIWQANVNSQYCIEIRC